MFPFLSKGSEFCTTCDEGSNWTRSTNFEKGFGFAENARTESSEFHYTLIHSTIRLWTFLSYVVVLPLRLMSYKTWDATPDVTNKGPRCACDRVLWVITLILCVLGCLACMLVILDCYGIALGICVERRMTSIVGWLQNPALTVPLHRTLISRSHVMTIGAPILLPFDDEYVTFNILQVCLIEAFSFGPPL